MSAHPSKHLLVIEDDVELAALLVSRQVLLSCANSAHAAVLASPR
jgi:hypothetical protein